MAMRARLRNVGTTRPVSSCDRKLAERPVCLPNSTRPIDFFRRKRLMRSPMCFSAMNRSVVSLSTCDFWVSSLRTAASSVISDPPGVHANLVAPIKIVSYITKVAKAGQSALNSLKVGAVDLMYVEMSKDPQRVVERPDKIVISGASGMLGAALRSRLSADGRSVLRLVRHAAAGPDELTWNPSASTAMEDPAALEGCSAAIHLSGASIAGHRWTKKYKRQLLSSRVDSTQALSRLLAGLHRPPQTLVVASAVGIYGD